MKGNILVTNIKQLLTFGGHGIRKGKHLSDIGLVKADTLLIKDGKIDGFGNYREIKKNPAIKKAKIISADGVVMPGFCDSHTHAVFMNPRLKDFSLRIKGLSYKQIKSEGGGIISSINDVRRAGKSVLTDAVIKNARRFLSCGTTTIEAKSGYGLSLESEIKSLQAIKNAAKKSPLEFVPTLLAAHSVPPKFSSAEKYTDFVIKKIIPQVARQKLAKYCDVFCEKGFFNIELSRKILKTALKYGLKPKIHAEQLTRFGGARLGALLGAVSADHVDYASDSDIKLIAEKGVIATLLPACNHYLGIDKYPPARKMIQAGVAIALATDFNPGSSPCWNMQFVISLACIKMKMTVEQCLTSATVNGAYAMGLGGKRAMIAKGVQADLAIFDIKDYREIAYYFGSNLCKCTIKKGKICSF